MSGLSIQFGGMSLETMQPGAAEAGGGGGVPERRLAVTASQLGARILYFGASYDYASWGLSSNAWDMLPSGGLFSDMHHFAHSLDYAKAFVQNGRDTDGNYNVWIGIWNDSDPDPANYAYDSITEWTNGTNNYTSVGIGSYFSNYSRLAREATGSPGLLMGKCNFGDFVEGSYDFDIYASYGDRRSAIRYAGDKGICVCDTMPYIRPWIRSGATIDSYGISGIVIAPSSWVGVVYTATNRAYAFDELGNIYKLVDSGAQYNLTYPTALPGAISRVAAISVGGNPRVFCYNTGTGYVFDPSGDTVIATFGFLDLMDSIGITFDFGTYPNDGLTEAAGNHRSSETFDDVDFALALGYTYQGKAYCIIVDKDFSIIAMPFELKDADGVNAWSQWSDQNHIWWTPYDAVLA